VREWVSRHERSGNLGQGHTRAHGARYMIVHVRPGERVKTRVAAAQGLQASQ
jgi:hypothetical protein